MKPNGEVFTIDSPAVRAWWLDFEKGRCLSCESPAQAARLHQRARNAALRDAGGPRSIHLLKPRYLEVGWGEAWLFYPTTGEMPSYVVVRGGVGAGAREWDSWQPATERMEQMILSSDVPRKPPQQTSGASKGREPKSGMFIAILLVLGLLILATMTTMVYRWFRPRPRHRI